jgi:site-specific recombinase XerD
MRSKGPNRTQIMQYQAQWERYVASTASESTSAVYSRGLQKFLERFPEKGEPSQFSRMDVMDFRAARRKAGISARQTNYEVQVVGRFFRWLIDMGVVAYNPAQGIKMLKEEDPVRESFQPSEQELLYNACLNDKERLLVGLSLTTGLRGTTLAQLEKKEFLQESQQLVIPPQKMKTLRSHVLPLRQRELDLVAALPEGFIWGKWGNTYRQLVYRWNKICQRAGVSLRGLRSVRRTAATTLIRQGEDIRIVQQWLGHRNIAQTQKYLTAATPPQLRAALLKMPGGDIGTAVVQPERSSEDSGRTEPEKTGLPD